MKRYFICQRCVNMNKNNLRNQFLENFQYELLNVERAFIRDSKRYFFNLDTKIQNFQASIFFKQQHDILKTYLQINKILNIVDDNDLKNIYTIRIKILLDLTNKLFNNINIYEQED